MFAAVDQGNTALTTELDHHPIDPIFTDMQQQVTTQAVSYRAEAIQNLANLTATEQLVFVSTLFVFPIGLLLLVGLLFVVRTYQRRIDEGTSAELARLARTAFTDNLTDLGNHRAYQEDLHRILASVSGHKESLALAIVDIDGLKMINEMSGHLEGDRVLTTFAAILRKGRRFEGIYRLSGDEFAIILPHMTLGEATDTMEQLRHDAEQGLSGATVSMETVKLVEELAGEVLFNFLEEHAQNPPSLCLAHSF